MSWTRFSRTPAGRGAFVMGLGAMALVGCKDLPSIAAGSCGNAIVEPELGEVCDTFAQGEGTACRAPGLDGACQFDCTPDAAGTAPRCPSGWGCGADRICRAPSGVFALGNEVELGAASLATDDFDGDGRADLLATTYDTFSVMYFGTDRTLGKTVTESALQPFGNPPAHADFDGDGRADLAILSGSGGIRVELGSGDGSFTPTVQSSITTPGTNARFIAVDAVEPAGDEVLVTVDGPAPGKTLVLAVRTQVDNGGTPPLLFTLDGPADGLAGDAIATELFQREDAQGAPLAGCEEVVLAFKGKDVVYVLEPCVDAGDAFVKNAAPGTITLPSGGIVGDQVFVADVNGDGTKDVLVLDPQAYDLGCIGIDVAYGVGDGTFHDDASSLPPANGNNRAACLVADLQSPGNGPVGWYGATPIAVGDIDGDGRADLVDTFGVFLSEGPVSTGFSATYRLAATSDDAGWSHAAILDATGDGRPDVLASKAQGGGASFLLNAGNGFFNTFGTSVQGQVRNIAVGDFDGDLLGDFILAKRDDDESVGTLDVLFGRAFGAPEAPQSLGSLESIAQLVPGDNLFRALLADLGDSLTATDGTTDLAVVFGGADDAGAVALLPGSTDRRLASPVFLVQKGDKEILAATPFLSVAGPFADGAAADFATLAWSAGGEARLWTLPSTGNGLLGDAVVTQALPNLYDWYLGSVVSDDVDGDGRAELIGLTYRLDTFDAVLLVASADASGLFASYVEVPLSVPGGFGQLSLADLDGDGDRDVIVLERAYLDAGIEGGAGGTSTENVIVLYTENGQLGAAGRTDIVPGEASVQAFAALSIDADPELELVVLTSLGLHPVQLTPDTSLSLGEPVNTEVAGAYLATAGDFDGDGVADLAVSDGVDVLTLFQEPQGR